MLSPCFLGQQLCMHSSRTIQSSMGEKIYAFRSSPAISIRGRPYLTINWAVNQIPETEYIAVSYNLLFVHMLPIIMEDDADSFVPISFLSPTMSTFGHQRPLLVTSLYVIAKIISCRSVSAEKMAQTDVMHELSMPQRTNTFITILTYQTA